MENFTSTLLEALEQKSAWYDSTGLPAILENYRLLHTCITNLLEALSKKSLLTPDPYKTEKKISDIKAPESTPFTDQERSMILGMRTSDYDNTMDFLCNYYKFSVSNLTIGNIRKLVDLNNWIQWTSFTPNNPKLITRSLATLVFNMRQNSDAITQSMLNDSCSKASKAMQEINKGLKEFTDFQKEMYKGSIRKNVFTHPGFNASKAAESPAEEISYIKKCFSAAMGKIPFYNDLVDEIIKEDHDSDKENLQNALIKKLGIQKETQQKKEVKVDTKDMILAAARALGALPPQLTSTMNKIRDNHEVLESEHNSFMDKLKEVFRKAFNIQPNPTIYSIVIVEQTTETRRNEKLNYQTFMTEMDARLRRYMSISGKGNPGYEKLASMDEEKILDFINKQFIECNKMMQVLTALDNFFKAAASPQNRPKIKGLKMEITSIKNVIVKVNQHRAEYTAYIEEAEQMKKLGINI